MLYLAVPIETYQDFFQLSFVQRTLDRYQIKLIIYDPKREEIRLWIK
ncbi:MAG: element excision factor XisH family protein [Nostoc sp.]